MSATERFNEITAEEIERTGYETGMGIETLPCGELAHRYWQDADKRVYAQCRCGCTFRRGTHSEHWHTINSYFE